jgi:DNA-binding NarL/FixJ family response regulator
MLLDKIRVLLVEDNPADVRLVREVVAEPVSARPEIVHVTRLSEAISRVRKDRFDVALLDLGLPDSRGLETFFEFQRAAPGLPVVVLTGLDDESVGVEAVRNGAQDFLVKGSLGGTVLIRAIRHSIERGRLLKELVDNVAWRKEAEEDLRKGQTSHIWLSLYRLLGGGASAVLYGAGTDAALATRAFIQEQWNPRDEDAFVRAMIEHFRAGALCDSMEISFDRQKGRATIRSRGNFETALVKGKEAAPVCHFFRGLLTGLVGPLLGGSDLVCDERDCEAQGKEACSFSIHPMFG